MANSSNSLVAFLYLASVLGRLLALGAGGWVVARATGLPERTDGNQLVLTAGRFFTYEDETEMANYCVLGAGVADKLFPFEEPLGKTIQMRGHRFLVIGVTAERVASAGAGGSQASE